MRYGAFLIPWDALSPDQRRLAAQQHDQKHDPDAQAVNRYWFGLTGEIAHWDNERQQYERMEPQSVTEKAEQDRQQRDIRQRIEVLQSLFDKPPHTVEMNGLRDMPPDELREVAKGATSAPETEAIGTPETEASTALVLRKADLIRTMEREWPNIRSDLSNAQNNGLKCAQTGIRGIWDVDKCRVWAKSNGRIGTVPAATASSSSPWSGSVTRYTSD
jgi:hypothetical protein